MIDINERRKQKAAEKEQAKEIMKDEIAASGARLRIKYENGVADKEDVIQALAQAAMARKKYEDKYGKIERNCK